MRLIRPWLKTELKSILQVGTNAAPLSHRRGRNRSKKQHVQCVEVDEKRSALKINDTESMVWCFVSTPCMKHFKSSKSTFGSLNSKTITIEDWEFSSLSVLCPSFEQNKAKSNGQICILISKFSLLSGERTTTVGYPTDLGEGNRDMRAMLRSLSNPKNLVPALARGQGLTDLRDADGVVMSAPSLRMSWSDVDPELLMASATAPAPASEPASAPPTVPQQSPQHGQQQRPPCAASPGGARSPAEGDAPGGVGAVCRSLQRSGEPAVDDMSQMSLGMEYEGGLEESQDMFHTQAPSAGNVLSQEAMDMRPASPSPSSTPSPTSPAVDGAPVAAAAATPATAVGAAAAVAAAPAPAVAAAASASAVASGRQASIPPLAGTPSPPSVLPQLPPEVELSTDDGDSSSSSGSQEREVVKRVTRSMKVKEAPLHAGAEEKVREGEGEDEDEEEKEWEEQKEEEESQDSPVPPGLTQLCVLPEVEAPGQPPNGADGEDDGLENTEDPALEWRAGKGAAGAGVARGDRNETITKGMEKGKGKEMGKGKGKGKGKEKGKGKGRAKAADGDSNDGLHAPLQQPTEPALEQESASEATINRAKGKGKGKATASVVGDGGGRGGASSDAFELSPSPDDILSPEELSGLTSSSSLVRSPAFKQLELNYLTQKRQKEGECHPGSGARAASRECDIRSRFRSKDNGGGGEGSRSRDNVTGGRPAHDGGGSARGGGSGSGGGSERSAVPTPDTDKKPGGGVRSWRNPIYEKAAKMLLARPLQNGSAPGRKRTRSLSDILVTVDVQNWDGQGRPTITARGHMALSSLANWMDESQPQKPPRTSIGGWLDRCKDASERRNKRSTGDGGGDGGGSSSGAR